MSKAYGSVESNAVGNSLTCKFIVEGRTRTLTLTITPSVTPFTIATATIDYNAATDLTGRDSISDGYIHAADTKIVLAKGPTITGTATPPQEPDGITVTGSGSWAVYSS